MAPNLPIRKAFNVMEQIMLSPVYEMIDVLTQEDVRGVRDDFRGCTKVRLGVGYGGSRPRKGPGGGGGRVHFPLVRFASGRGPFGRGGGELV